MLPVARLLPEPLVDEERRRDLLIPVGVERLPRELLQLTDEHHAVRQPERRSGSHVVEIEEIQLAPELSMVALLRFLDAPEILVQLVGGEPRGPVDALEHRVLLAAAPVRTRRGEQLEVLDVTRGRHVRPTAEIDELALLVQRHSGRIEALEDLHLEGLLMVAKEPDGLAAVHLAALEAIVSAGDLAHGGLDPREVLGRERRRSIEIVVEAVFDRRSDRQLHLGIETLHGLRHHVRGRVSERGERRRIAVEVARQGEMSFFLRRRHTLPGER